MVIADIYAITVFMSIDLHRSAKVPQWELVEPSKRNIWQRWSAKTHGWLSPANLVSFGGAALFLDGLYDYSQGQKGVGFAKMVVGGAADWVDGKVAHATKTKSPLGEIVDASLDKIKLAGALIVFGVTEVVPVVPLVAVTAQNAANVVFTGIAKHRGKEIHAELPNKLTPWIQGGVGMGGFVVADMLAPGTGQQVAEVAGYAGTVVGSIFPGGWGTKELADQALKPQELPEAA